MIAVCKQPSCANCSTGLARACANMEGMGDTWRDTSGKRLVDYPRPSLAVDVAVLTVYPGAETSPRAGTLQPGGLAVLVHRRAPEPPSGRPGSGTPGEWSLPGTFLHEGERLADAVVRVLRDKVGIAGVTSHQLRVFDDPARDPRGWVVSVAHAVVVPNDALVAMLAGRDDVVVRPLPHHPGGVADAVADLAFDHQEIVAEAVRDLRALYEEYPDPLGLLPEPFTLLQLRLLHEAILGEALQKDTFRRRMEPHLHATDQMAEGIVGRPARLFHRM